MVVLGIYYQDGKLVENVLPKKTTQLKTPTTWMLITLICQTSLLQILMTSRKGFHARAGERELMGFGVGTNVSSAESPASVFLSAGQQGYHLSSKFHLTY